MTTLAAGSIDTPRNKVDPEAVRPVESIPAARGAGSDRAFRRSSATMLEPRR